MSKRMVVDEFRPGDGRFPGVTVPDTDEPMVSRSVRLPLHTYERVRTAADARGLGVTTLMRQWIEAGLAELDDSTTVSLADVRRAISALAGQRSAA